MCVSMWRYEHVNTVTTEAPKTSDPLELKLQMVVSLGAGN